MTVGGELLKGGHPVAFYSKKLTPTEARYHVTDREIMAKYLACMKGQHYLHGSVCSIYSNHEPLIYILYSCNLTLILAKLIGWIVWLN